MRRLINVTYYCLQRLLQIFQDTMIPTIRDVSVRSVDLLHGWHTLRMEE